MCLHSCICHVCRRQIAQSCKSVRRLAICARNCRALCCAPGPTRSTWVVTLLAVVAVNFILVLARAEFCLLFYFVHLYLSILLNRWICSFGSQRMCETCIATKRSTATGRSTAATKCEFARRQDHGRVFRVVGRRSLWHCEQRVDDAQSNWQYAWRYDSAGTRRYLQCCNAKSCFIVSLKRFFIYYIF